MVMMELGAQAWITLGVVVAVLVLLASNRVGPDMVLAAGMTVLLVSGVLKPAEALGGFANSGVMTVAVLFVVVAGLRETGAIQWIAALVLGKPRGLFLAQLRLIVASSSLSAFVNNTPVVAMLTSATQAWSKEAGLAPSKLLLPMNYATILGGLCTLIGTSTNLVVDGLLRKQGMQLDMFTPVWVGVPVVVVGAVYMLTLGRWLLPERKSAVEQVQDARQYTVEMIVDENGPLVGRSIEEAGLRRLQQLYLVELVREGRVLGAIPPQYALRGGDQLVFVGVVDSLVDLRRIKGLSPATNQVFKLGIRDNQRCLIEAVISRVSPVTGRTIREARFRNRYNAAVIAVSRNGQRIPQKIGDIVLRAGDTLLLEGGREFARQHRYSRDFLLVSELDDSTPPQHARAPYALAILAGLVVSTTLFDVETLNAALIAAAAMVLLRCCNQGQARRAVDYQLIVIIACSFALGTAMEKTGLASYVAGTMMGYAGGDPLWTLVVVYVTTVIFTELLTNNAAAVLMFPIGMAAATQLGVNPMPFVMCVMVGASAGFMTPIGYQTNLMVYGPGGYRFMDYVIVGGPLSLLVGITTLTVVPLVWPFH